MQSLGSLARNIKPNQNIVEEEHNLKCERCGNTYDYYNSVMDKSSDMVVNVN